MLNMQIHIVPTISWAFSPESALQNSIVLANDSDENQEQRALLLPQKQSVMPV